MMIPVATNVTASLLSCLPRTSGKVIEPDFRATWLILFPSIPIAMKGTVM